MKALDAEQKVFLQLLKNVFQNVCALHAEGVFAIPRLPAETYAYSFLASRGYIPGREDSNDPLIDGVKLSEKRFEESLNVWLSDWVWPESLPAYADYVEALEE